MEVNMTPRLTAELKLQLRECLNSAPAQVILTELADNATVFATNLGRITRVFNQANASVLTELAKSLPAIAIPEPLNEDAEDLEAQYALIQERVLQPINRCLIDMATCFHACLLKTDGNLQDDIVAIIGEARLAKIANNLAFSAGCEPSMGSAIITRLLYASLFVLVDPEVAGCATLERRFAYQLFQDRAQRFNESSQGVFIKRDELEPTINAAITAYETTYDIGHKVIVFNQMLDGVAHAREREATRPNWCWQMLVACLCCLKGATVSEEERAAAEPLIPAEAESGRPKITGYGSTATSGAEGTGIAGTPTTPASDMTSPRVVDTPGGLRRLPSNVADQVLLASALPTTNHTRALREALLSGAPVIITPSSAPSGHSRRLSKHGTWSTARFSEATSPGSPPPIGNPSGRIAVQRAIGVGRGAAPVSASGLRVRLSQVPETGVGRQGDGSDSGPEA
jgi:hypothetical protein